MNKNKKFKTSASYSGPSVTHSQMYPRYDRQLRLWGDHGQKSLEHASVCLVNATATGTEILKSLVLPGVGSFTILDPNKVCSDAYRKIT